MPAVEYGWLKAGGGDGSCTSLIPMGTQIDLVESAEVEATPGFDGRIFQVSTGAGIVAGGEGWDQIAAPAGELGRSGGWRTTSTILGSGGSSGLNRPMMLFLTSSLLPPSSSPAPSSSSPSSADTWVL